MSKKEEFTEEDNEIMLEAIGMAAKKFVRTPVDKFEETFLSIWAEAIHKLLLRREQCPCQKGKNDQCFLSLKPKEQKAALKSHSLLNFNNFLKVIIQGGRLFLRDIRDIVEANKNRNVDNVDIN